VSPVSSSSIGFAQAYDVAVLRKAKEQTEIEGKATLELLASASRSSRPPDGTGTLIDDVA
jgi:hypothetical protein